MKDIWEKAKKQYHLGVDAVMKKTGIKNEPEDPNFLNHWEKLQNIEISTMKIYKSISDLTNASQNLCDISVATSSAISSSFDTTDAPNFENSQKTVSYLTDCKNYCKGNVWDEVNEKCLGPLREYMNRIMELKKFAEKRKKNKVLCESASDPQELAKRQEKYTRYNSSYLEGVEEISTQQTDLFVQVFNEYQAIMKNFIEYSKKGLDVLADQTESDN